MNLIVLVRTHHTSSGRFDKAVSKKYKKEEKLEMVTFP